nr:MAG TPA: hypothetical protein [Caudoviricetes sp.]
MEEKNMDLENNEEIQEVEQETEEVLEVQNNEDVQETENNNEDTKNEDVQEKINHVVQARLDRERRNFERDNKELYEMENILKAGLEVDNRADMIKQLKEFYGDKADIKPYKSSANERDEKILAEADAKEVIELGMNEMEAEANRIASIPEAKRTIREKTMFNTICGAIIEQREVNELKAKGVDTNILENKEFVKFKEKFNYNTPISEIYDMYSKINQKPEKPASAGSAKSETGKESKTFTPEQINNMSPQELMKYWNDPAFRKVAGLN